MEDDRLAGQLFRVVLGEGDVDVLLIAGLQADELLLKPGHKRVGAQLQRVALGRTAVKRLAVQKALKVDVDGISHLGGAVHVQHAGVALLDDLDLLVDGLVRNLLLLLIGLDALVLAQHRHGIQRHVKGKLDALVVRDLDVGDAGLSDDAELALLHAGVIAVGGQLVHGVLIEHLAAVHTLDHLPRGLALAEAGDIDILFILQVGLLHGLFKFRRVRSHRKRRFVRLVLVNRF